MMVSYILLGPSTSRETNFTGFVAVGDNATGKALFITKADSQINLEEKGAPTVVITTSEIWSLLSQKPSRLAVILVENPKLAFSILANHFPEGQRMRERHDGIHQTAIVDDDIMLPKDIHIGPYTVIGAEGLNINRQNNSIINTTHLGKVILGQGIRIGSNCVIQRAVLGETKIGDFTLIAHNIVIGHGVKIGKNNVISSNVMISGSVKTGNDVYIGPGCTFKNGITIGDNVFVGIGSNVLIDVPPDVVIAGNPARILKGSKRPW